MIIDRLENASQYYGLGERLASGLRYLKNTDFSQMEAGRYELDGASLYVLVQQYVTKPRESGSLEAHRRYIDLHYMLKGEELIGYANLSGLTTGEYDSNRDHLRLLGPAEFLLVPAGTFMILLPQDAHMPGIAVKDPQPVKKVVVKISVA